MLNDTFECLYKLKGDDSMLSTSHEAKRLRGGLIRRTIVANVAGFESGKDCPYPHYFCPQGTKSQLANNDCQTFTSVAGWSIWPRRCRLSLICIAVTIAIIMVSPK
jgi:hypothetical protein